jgi:hypothetical protein
MLFQHPAKARASVASGELWPPRISAQVVIEPLRNSASRAELCVYWAKNIGQGLRTDGRSPCLFVNARS